MKIDRTVFLIGFMGSGKTYWGATLAEKLGIPFYDLDALIEAKAANSIAQIFTQLGEAAFRELERDTLHESNQLGTAIVATGGGTPCFFDNMAWMNAVGKTIYLKTPPSLIAARLKHEQHTRPLLASLAAEDLESHIESLLRQREPYYSQATITIEQTTDEAAFFDALQGALR
jgi:shikimate kinase